ncbi:MAG: phosphoribosyltransferase [Patescibacteria group bacterium]|nr:phosphoribosyltransferase [Patescibacteria group bacterium]
MANRFVCHISDLESECSMFYNMQESFANKASLLKRFGHYFLSWFDGRFGLDDLSILAIPRGAVPLAYGMKDCYPDVDITYVNAGFNYDKSQGCLLEKPKGKRILIIDSIIDTGKTVMNVLEDINRFGFDLLYVNIFTVFATTDGIDNLTTKYPNVSVYYVKIDDNFDWINAADGTKKRIIKGLDDFGEYARYV